MRKMPQARARPGQQAGVWRHRLSRQFALDVFDICHAQRIVWLEQLQGHVLALKRILPSYARDPRLVGRFLDEARLCARLDHSNVVHVVDFGTVDGEYYLVMEWVDGVNLFALLRGLAQRGQRLPIEVTAYVIAEATVATGAFEQIANSGGIAIFRWK